MALMVIFMHHHNRPDSTCRKGREGVTGLFKCADMDLISSFNKDDVQDSTSSSHVVPSSIIYAVLQNHCLSVRPSWWRGGPSKLKLRRRCVWNRSCNVGGAVTCEP